MTHRIFIPPGWINGQQVVVEGEVLHRLKRVLRMTPGDEVILMDNSGKEYLVRILALNSMMGEGEVVSSSGGYHEPRVKITLCQGILKGKKLEWVLQKGTELGITTFVPLVCRRSVPTQEEEKNLLRLSRWVKIITEASEQSGRSLLPVVELPTPFELACQAVGDSALGLIPWERAPQESNIRAVLRRRQLSKVHIFIGPEGGFQESEVAYASSRGIVPVSLGNRILRAETAGLVAATAVMYESGEMGS